MAGLPEGQLLNSQASVRVVGVPCEEPKGPTYQQKMAAMRMFHCRITSSALILCWGSYHDGVATSSERVKESSNIHFGPAIIVGGDDVDRIDGVHSRQGGQ